MTKHIAVYVRVSSKKQDTKSQEPDLKRWEQSQEGPVRWYVDKASGKSMSRPQWNKLEDHIRTGKVSTVVVWRLDRLGRTASGLTSLFDTLQSKSINLVSIKDGLDLSTPAGRLLGNMMASVAQYESEVRGERVRAGQAVAKANGKTWGGSKKGVRKKVTQSQVKAIKQMKHQGVSISEIARTFQLGRMTIYDVLST